MCATSLFPWKGVLGSKVPPLPRNVALFVWAAALNSKGVFGFAVSITHNSKIVGPMTQKIVWITITLFP